MITILHGDDIVPSRGFLDNIKKVEKPTIFNVETVTPTDIIQVVAGESLFTQTKKILIENFFTKKGKHFKDIVSYLKLNEKKVDLFLWEGKELSKKESGIFEKAILKTFKIPSRVFSFLDGIKPKNSNSLIVLFHRLLDNTDADFIFYMLVRQFRLLLAVSQGEANSIEEVSRLKPWQKSKLQRQASYFSKDSLLMIYKKIYEIDLAQKTGRSPLSQVQAIDFLLLSF